MGLMFLYLVLITVQSVENVDACARYEKQLLIKEKNPKQIKFFLLFIL